MNLKCYATRYFVKKRLWFSVAINVTANALFVCKIVFAHNKLVFEMCKINHVCLHIVNNVKFEIVGLFTIALNFTIIKTFGKSCMCINQR